ncbi:ECF-type sigma factor [Aquabacterium sp.]|uniref:ECF-type sigma factor n=1 Tax=Aquabacterium sp. TaxID=1872578 RepID=UPI002BB5A98E|nr:ECF-type sigma factor [Aquabacterium sp.]HSW03593.1 ECF-type sigma factor [Aquabacterium sp.]
MATDNTPIDDVAGLLARARAGDEQALHPLFQGLYDDLSRLARRRLRAGAPITLLDTGALVHESFERFVRLDKLDVHDRAHFLGYAARVMRSIIVDAARERASQRAGGGAVHVTLTAALGDALAQPATEPDVLRVHDALQALALIEPRLAQGVELRYFGGLSNAEIAGVLGIGLRTVERDWERARSFLFATIGPDT